MFINQKFAGGIDVVTELLENDEFDEMVPASCKALAPKEQVQKILADNNMVLLINGSLQEPADDESKKLVEKVYGLNVEFTAIDVQAKPEYLEHFSKDQKVPYVFLKGKPACGLEGVDQLGSSAP